MKLKFVFFGVVFCSITICSKCSNFFLVSSTVALSNSNDNVNEDEVVKRYIDDFNDKFDKKRLFDGENFDKVLNEAGMRLCSIYDQTHDVDLFLNFAEQLVVYFLQCGRIKGSDSIESIVQRFESIQAVCLSIAVILLKNDYLDKTFGFVDFVGERIYAEWLTERYRDLVFLLPLWHKISFYQLIVDICTMNNVEDVDLIRRSVEDLLDKFLKEGAICLSECIHNVISREKDFLKEILESRKAGETEYQTLKHINLDEQVLNDERAVETVIGGYFIRIFNDIVMNFLCKKYNAGFGIDWDILSKMCDEVERYGYAKKILSEVLFLNAYTTISEHLST